MFLVICLIIDDPLVMVYFLVNKIKGPASHSLSFNWFEFSSSLVTKVKFLFSVFLVCRVDVVRK